MIERQFKRRRVIVRVLKQTSPVMKQDPRSRTYRRFSMTRMSLDQPFTSMQLFRIGASGKRYRVEKVHSIVTGRSYPYERFWQTIFESRWGDG